MKKTSLNSDDFIKSLPEESRADIAELDKAITKVMSGQPKSLWQGKFWGGSEQQIIGYGDYTVKRPEGDIEWFVIGLAVQKNYISIYMSVVENGQYVAEKYGQGLGKVKVGKSSISFKRLEDIDMKKLTVLIRKARELTLK